MKNYKDLILGFIILVLCAALIYSFYDNPVKTTNNVADIIKIDSAKPDVFIDGNGKTHVQKQIVYVKDEQAALLYRAQIDSLRAQLDLGDKDIRGVVSASGSGEITFRPDIVKITDSIKREVYSTINFTSRWFDLKGDTKSGTFKAFPRDSISVSFIDKPSGFLNLKSTMYADVSSANPDMKYTNIRAWLVPEKRNNKAKIGLGVTAGYGVQMSKDNSFSHGFQVTGGLQYRF